MQHKITRIFFSVTIAVLFSAVVLLFTGESEAYYAPVPCPPNAAVTTIFYRTAAQLEPVGGLYVPGCATKPGTVWGTSSLYSVTTCGPILSCG